ncbi:UDP-glucosyl transferase 85A3 [Perilla frutescens var. hirtella]|uniref:Glycosyltransferase n=1 Tax=Perilla frutescens var. hirtella TaxID=608512 RepID=A0AAD4P6A5_PERFH|nr:UDP-glucosyl transferase 85A3 [Perilla frutescens var. hirtella]
MDSISRVDQKPHAVCIPFPAQGHVNPMLKLAKLLHHKGFFITFVNTDYNHRRLLNSRGAASLDGLPRFRFETIPDGLPPSDADATQDIPSLCASTTTTCLEPFCDLLSKINSSEAPPVTCIVSDGAMSFTLKAAERFRLPEVLFWTASACGILAYTQYRDLVEKGYTPLQDMKQVTDGYLETTINWIPGMNNIRLRDIPSFIRTTDPNDVMLNFVIQESAAIPKARALILNTFAELERDAVVALSAMFPRVYTVGPLQLMTDHVLDQQIKPLSSSLWKEEVDCLNWLDTMEPESVVYVNFGSITVMTADQMTEFAWGLAKSGKPFLWIIRPDVVAGETAMLPAEFVAETEDRSMLVSWCPQEKVLKHPAVGGFLTHCGWNSTSESIVSGVPVICWPFFAEQQTNCRYSCVEWGIGMEIDNDVKRDEVEFLVRELMEGERGERMKENAVEWKRKAEEAAAIGGSSCLNLEKLIEDLLLQ